MLNASPAPRSEGVRASSGFSILLVALLVCLLAIDRQSFWMDELGTWQYVGVRGIGAWFRGFLAIRNSDGQLPLYHFMAFGWSRLLGSSELALRSLNALLLIGAMAAIGWTRGVPRDLATRWALLLLCNCFLWAYLNEARPYVMLVAGSVFLTLALLRSWTMRAEPGACAMGPVALLFLTGALLSFGASPIAAPYIAAYLVAILALLGWKGVAGLRRMGPGPMLYALACVAAACIVSALVLYSMAKGATPETRNSTSVATMLFGVLEVMGAGGYVPGRDLLRVAGIHAIAAWQWALLATLCLAWAASFVAALAGRYRRAALILVTVTGFSMLCVIGAGYGIGFRIVGRHFAFAVPPMMLVMAMGCEQAGSGRRWMAPAFALLLLGSTALFRLDGAHRKDDTAAAAALVKAAQARGERSWWVGGYLVPLYFDVPTRSFASAAGAGRGAVKAEGRDDWARSMERLPRPDLILVERPEVNDPNGAFARYAMRHGLSRRIAMRGYTAYRAP
ncbi:MAG: hypothetical protein DI606_00210 [Sphingobium sp.]|uniref:hypothetical protein n=1 Tax=Sphingobium sp. TaxID=1912891 RepID=UPI000DB23DD2|nr:hypothetical protein [Sphingobium sp.]PZU15034.1 MAG: hypothetical protein DI606_00210 [Sphingobium sp.]